MLYTPLRTVALWGYNKLLPPSRAETNILGKLSFSVVSATVPNSYLLESQTRLSQTAACLGDARTLTCFTSVFAFSNMAPYHDLRPHTRPFFNKWCEGQRHCVGWGRKVLPNSHILTKPCTSFIHILGGWIGLHLINHSFSPNQMAPKDFVTVAGPWIVCTC